MSFNYLKEKEKFENEWKQQEGIMLAEGMSPESIIQIYSEDWECFKRNRQYIRHKVNYESIELSQSPGIELGDFFVYLNAFQTICCIPPVMT